MVRGEEHPIIPKWWPTHLLCCSCFEQYETEKLETSECPLQVHSRSIADPVDLGPALQGPLEHAGPGPLGSEWPLMALSPHAGLEGPPSGALEPALACWPSSPVNWPWCPPRRTCCKVQSPRATPLHAALLQPMYMNPMKLVIPLHSIS